MFLHEMSLATDFTLEVLPVRLLMGLLLIWANRSSSRSWDDVSLPAWLAYESEDIHLDMLVDILEDHVVGRIETQSKCQEYT